MYEQPTEKEGEREHFSDKKKKEKRKTLLKRRREKRNPAEKKREEKTFQKEGEVKKPTEKGVKKKERKTY